MEEFTLFLDTTMLIAETKNASNRLGVLYSPEKNIKNKLKNIKNIVE